MFIMSLSFFESVIPPLHVPLQQSQEVVSTELLRSVLFHFSTNVGVCMSEVLI